MAKGSEKVSVNKLEGLFDNSIQTVVFHGKEDFNVNIKRILPLDEAAEFVQDIVSYCVDADSGEYSPEGYDLAIRTGVLTRYANFTMPSSFDKQYALVYGTDAFDTVMKYINVGQFQDIVRAADRKISFTLGMLTSTAASEMMKVVKKLNEVADSSNAAFSKLDDDKFNDFVTGLAALGSTGENALAKAIVTTAKSGE